jgi:DNA-binding GntR family transcriptional regulator
VHRYQQIAAYLRAGIEDGTYPPGTKLPTEAVLRHQYGVGRETARRALVEVRRGGLADMVHGQGTIVRWPEELRPISVPRGSKIRSRLPKPEEIAEHDLPDGVSMLVVIDPAGRFKAAYPGHLYEIPIK